MMQQDKEYKGTTTVGLVCKDGIVMASERRATMGNFVASRRAKKIYQISDNVGLTTAGSVGDAQFLTRLMKVETYLYNIRKEQKPTVKSIATMVSNMLNNSRFFPYLVQLIIGGVDEDGPTVFSLDPVGGAIEEEDIVATGSGSMTAYGVLEDRYASDLTVDQGVELVIRAVTSAIKRDSASGDGIDVVRITRDEFYHLTDEEVEEVASKFKK